MDAPTLHRNAVSAEHAAVQQVYGVDLGTTHTVVAHAAADGRIDCVPLGTSSQDVFCMPSVVSVTPGDHVLVGEAALHAVHNADVVAAVETKRILGREADDPYLARETQRWCVDTQPDGLDGVAVHIPAHANGRRERGLTAMGATVCLLAHAARCVHRTRPAAPLRHAVIAAPVHFTDAQRGALLMAYACVGIHVHAVLSEPQAAAWAAVDDASIKPSANDVDLVVDLGGGTFDVGVVRWGAHGNVDSDGAQYRPLLLATDGDSALGGMNVDAALLDIAAKQQNDGVRASILRDKHALESALLRCRRAKEALSLHDTVDVCIPTWTSVTLTQQDLKDAHTDVLRMMRIATARALDRASVSPASICRVIHVGGASRAKPVRESLMHALPHAEHVHVHEASTIVARGAARYAQVLQSQHASITVHQDAAACVYAVHGLSIRTADGALHPLLPVGAVSGVQYYADEFTTDRSKDNVLVDIVEVTAGGDIVRRAGKVTLRFPLALDHRLHCVRVDACVDTQGGVLVDVWDQATRASCSNALNGFTLPTASTPPACTALDQSRIEAETIVLSKDVERVNTLRDAVFMLENYLARSNRLLMHPDFVAACGGGASVNTTRFTLDAALQSATLFMRQVRAHPKSFVVDDVTDVLGGVADYVYKSACALGLRGMVVDETLLEQGVHT